MLRFLNAMMGDVVSGRMTPQIANATCNVTGKILKLVEMEYRYGNTSGGKPPERNLRLTS